MLGGQVALGLAKRRDICRKGSFGKSSWLQKVAKIEVLSAF